MWMNVRTVCFPLVGALTIETRGPSFPWLRPLVERDTEQGTSINCGRMVVYITSCSVMRKERENVSNFDALLGEGSGPLP
jgi:hypothetical protein